MRDRGLHDPAGIAHYDNLAYGPDPRWQALDVYRPNVRAVRCCPSSSVYTAAAGCTAIKTCTAPAAQACNAEECEFFKRFIKGKELPYESR